MSPLNAAICTTTYLERQKCYGPGKKTLFKKQLFDLEVKVPRRSLQYATTMSYKLNLPCLMLHYIHVYDYI